MVRPISLTVGGKKYASRRAAADALGIDYALLIRRLGYGWTPEQAAGIDAPPEKKGNHSKEIIVAGHAFPSAKAAAEHFGIDPRTFRARLQRGDSPERAAGVMERVRSSAAVKSVVVGGKEYPSIKAACSVNGVKPSVFSKRISRGWTPEQAGEFEPPPIRTAKPRQSEIINGTEYPKADAGEYLLYLITNSVNDKEYVGITTNGLDFRFQGHISESRKAYPANPLHRAMKKHGVAKFKVSLLRNDAKNFVELMEQEVEEIEKRDTLNRGYNATFGGEIPANAIQVEVEGKTYPTLTAAAIAYGIEPKVVQLRVQRLGWALEKALEVGYSVKEEKAVVVGGTTYTSLKAAAEALGVPYRTAYARVKYRGYTLAQALGAAPHPEHVTNQPNKIVIDGIEFPSQAAAARHYGMSPSLLNRRVKNLGMSIEEALKTPKTK